MQEFIRTHLRMIVRYLLYTAAAVIVFSLLLSLCSAVSGAFSGPGSSSVSAAEKQVENNDAKKLESLLSSLSVSSRFQIEEKLLKKALKEKDPKQIACLLQAVSPAGHDALLLAVESPEGGWILEAMKQTKRGVDFTFSDASTLLEHSIKQENGKLFSFLLKSGADLNHPFHDGEFPVFHVLDKPPVLDALLKTGASVQVKDWNGTSLLLAAVEKKCYQVLPLISSRMKSFADCGWDGRTYLHILLSDSKTEIPGRAQQIIHVLKYPCAVNVADPDGKTPLQLAIANKYDAFIIPLLQAGAQLTPETEEAIQQTSKAKEFETFRKKHSKNPPKEKTEQTPVPFRSPWMTVPALPEPDFSMPVSLFLYVLAGLLALRLVGESKSPRLEPWRNLLVLAGGYFSLIVILGLRFCGGLFAAFRNVIDRIVARIPQDHVHLIASGGQEIQKAEDPEMAAALAFSGNFIEHVLRQNVREALILPRKEKYQIVFKRERTESVWMEPEAKLAIRVVKQLKALAGLNAFEAAKPQSGSFTALLGGEKKKILISTIGLGSIGERCVISSADVQESVRSFDQLKFAPEDKKQILKFLNGPSGLLLAAGPAGNGRRTFVSFLLEKAAEKNSSAAWIGNGTEPEGSDQVPRLKADPMGGTTVQQLLEAIPEYPTIAVTLGTDRKALPQIISMAASKRMVLLMDKPLKESLSICREASPQFDEVLKLAVRPWLFRKLCSCAKKQPVPPELLPAFRLIGEENGTISVPADCAHCQNGYTDSFVLYETADSSGPAQSGADTAVLTALKLASSGVLSQEELQKILKGE